MAESKKRTNRSLRATHRPERKHTGTKELVLTLSGPNGDVVKIETLEKSGQRHEMSDEEFAALASGDDAAEDLEAAYAAGVADANEHEFELDEGDEEEFERILGDGEGRKLFRRELRRLVLRGLLRSAMLRRRARSKAKSVHEAAHKASHNGQEHREEGG
jgi:hypothetical protein